MKVKISGEELVKAYDVAFSKLLEKTPRGVSWFDTEEEADDWAGDIAYEMIYHTIGALGIEIGD